MMGHIDAAVLVGLGLFSHYYCGRVAGREHISSTLFKHIDLND